MVLLRILSYQHCSATRSSQYTCYVLLWLTFPQSCLILKTCVISCLLLSDALQLSAESSEEEEEDAYGSPHAQGVGPLTVDSSSDWDVDGEERSAAARAAGSKRKQQQQQQKLASAKRAARTVPAFEVSGQPGPHRQSGRPRQAPAKLREVN
jgi:hypothetical protein